MNQMPCFACERKSRTGRRNVRGFRKDLADGDGRVWSGLVGLSSAMVRLTNKSNAVLPPRRAGDVGEGQGVSGV